MAARAVGRGALFCSQSVLLSDFNQNRLDYGSSVLKPVQILFQFGIVHRLVCVFMFFSSNFPPCHPLSLPLCLSTTRVRLLFFILCYLCISFWVWEACVDLWYFFLCVFLSEKGRKRYYIIQLFNCELTLINYKLLMILDYGVVFVVWKREKETFFLLFKERRKEIISGRCCGHGMICSTLSFNCFDFFRLFFAFTKFIVFVWFFYLFPHFFANLIFNQ